MLLISGRVASRSEHCKFLPLGRATKRRVQAERSCSTLYSRLVMNTLKKLSRSRPRFFVHGLETKSRILGIKLDSSQDCFNTRKLLLASLPNKEVKGADRVTDRTCESTGACSAPYSSVVITLTAVRKCNKASFFLHFIRALKPNIK